MPSEFSNLPQVNLKLLQTFILVGEHSSFRVAAEKSFRSQSAVGAQIRQLEEQLCVSLFHRTTRSVRLTDEGKQLMECAARALQEVEGGLRKIREAADLRRGRVSFSCSPSVAATRLAQVLSAFEREYPGVEIHVRERTSAALFESVQKREVDFGIGPMIETADFNFEPILKDPLYALVPRGFMNTSKDTVSLATLADMPLLLLDHATALRQMLEAAMRERGARLNMRYEFAQAQTLISMARGGLGVAILPGVVAPPASDKTVYRLRIVNPSMVRQVAVITAKGQSPSPACQRLIELLRLLIGNASAPEPTD